MSLSLLKFPRMCVLGNLGDPFRIIKWIQKMDEHGQPPSFFSCSSMPKHVQT